jgi:hypothetical protein
MCVDYRALNNITVKDANPLPSHVDLRQQILGAKFLSKLDIRDAFYMLRMAEESAPLTAFQTRYGLYEFVVAAMGLTNSPPAFMKLMNHIFYDLVDYILIYYMDDL